MASGLRTNQFKVANSFIAAKQLLDRVVGSRTTHAAAHAGANEQDPRYPHETNLHSFIAA